MTNNVAPERPLRPGTELDLLFTDLLANGQAVGRAGGLVVFCFGPLPGERARVRVTAVKRSYAVAEAISIDESSPERVTPFCPVFGECGGCQVQHLSYEAQLQWKRRLVQDALQRIGGIADAPVRETIASPNARAYRNKMSLVVTGGRDPEIGFYRMRSHDVVSIDECPVVQPRLNEQIRTIANVRAQPAIKEVLAEARHLVARYAGASDEVVLSVTTQHRSERVESAASALSRELPRIAGIVESYEPKGENAVLGTRFRVLSGRAEMEEEIAGIRYRVSPASFFQINTGVIARIFGVLEREFLPAPHVLDLYCGTGTFSLLFALRGSQVTGVDENRYAIAEAVENARLNGASKRAAFLARSVESYVQLKEGGRALSEAGAVFLDPPRNGGDPATLGAIVRARPPRVGYLSCDPATLARDLRVLVAGGYSLDSVQPFDMFPQTGHVEALALLRAQAR